MIPCENEDNIQRLQHDPGWFALLFRLMTQSREPFEENELSVITFNYDRSFEHLMYTALCNLYPGGPSGGRKRLASIPLVHLHGVLAGYPPLNNGRGRWYDATLSEAIVKRAEKAIKIIPDDDDHDGPLDWDDDFQRAYKLLDEAELVVFLGFGFDSLNVHRLALADYLSPNARVIATSKGLSQQALEQFNEDAQIRGEFEHLDATCTELFRRFGPVLTE